MTKGKCSVLLFLDVDGVLNNYTTKETFQGYTGINEKLLLRFSDMYHSIPNCGVVITSSWKHHDDFKLLLLQKLKEHKINVIGETTEADSFDRGRGILAFLKEYDFQSKKFFILDDEQFDYYECHLGWHFIQTSFYGHGLSDKHVNRLYKKLHALEAKKCE